MKKFLNDCKLYVDLAIEARDLVRGTQQVEISGVEEKVQELNHSTVHHIIIYNDEGAKSLARPIGSYVTIQSPPLVASDTDVKKELISCIAEYMQILIAEKINLQPDDTVLLVGLGNWRATPDSIGPKFIQFSPITRQYSKFAPDILLPGMRPCCGIAPGVLGITGLETFEVIKGIVDSVKPAVIIAVDSLAAQNIERIGCTIQLANTGIQPGAGIGNARHALNEETLGVPVLALGCPTIVNTATIAFQLIEAYCQKNSTHFDAQTIYPLVEEQLEFYGGTLAVTPKDVDDIVINSSKIMALGVASALFPNISFSELELFSL